MIISTGDLYLPRIELFNFSTVIMTERPFLLTFSKPLHEWYLVDKLKNQLNLSKPAGS